MTLDFSAVVAERDLDVAFTVHTGETVALLGENGAGKSTVLAVAAGLLHPDHGHVRIGERTLLDTSLRVDLAPHHRRVALLAQDPLLFPRMSVRGNVAFGPRSGGAGRRESAAAAERWLAAVGAEDLAGRRPTEISGGQAQRVALARALAVEPEVLLLDEPMAAVDVAARPALRQTLQRVLAGKTAVVVTHDVLDALLLADRVVVLERGHVVEDGRTHDVLARPRSRFAAHLAGLNLLGGTWSADHLVLDDGTRVFAMAPDGPADGDHVVASFSPRAVAVYRDAPAGSPRNSFPVVLTEVEPLGDVFRLRSDHVSGHLSADVTAQAVAELGLLPGTPVTFSVKATEVTAYPVAQERP
ncbi:sulfate/molybdate ABC transporter ATP-binding protein [Marmoricola sp. RAF53]|uniref:sulfate/molybdate ABC transporter ATP-binding protein n=1 Tax=Marmoricola sp. RAF53 TaxID=3233059 RepID=UPI003F9AB7CC